MQRRARSRCSRAGAPSPRSACSCAALECSIVAAVTPRSMRSASRTRASASCQRPSRSRSSIALTYMKDPNEPRMPSRAAARSPVSIASSAPAWSPRRRSSSPRCT